MPVATTACSRLDARRILTDCEDYIIMKKIQLCVLFGGRSSEYEVSLQSAYSVLTHADREKYDILPIGITKEGEWYFFDGSYESVRDGSWCADTSALDRVGLDLAAGRREFCRFARDGVHTLPVDVVFPVLHGSYGEDGTVQGMLSLAGIPFVGCGSASGAVCMDKVFTKQIVRTTGIRQAECVILYRDLWDSAAAEEYACRAEAAFGYPMFVKPARAGSSVGVSKVRNREEFFRAAEIAFREDSKVLVEEAIDGREIEVAVLNEGNHYTVSDCAEIVTGADFYDYEAKYQSSASGYHIPARLPEDVREQVRRCAEIIFRALDCRGLSRVDFFVNDRGNIVFNEINTLPGFTNISMYPKLMMHTGMTYSELIDRLVASAM